MSAVEEILPSIDPAGIATGTLVPTDDTGDQRHAAPQPQQATGPGNVLGDLPGQLLGH